LGEEKNILAVPEGKPQILGRPACSLVTILTELSCLHLEGHDADVY